MNYLELLKLAAPEAVLVLAAVLLLSIGLISARAHALSALAALLGLAGSMGAVATLPRASDGFGGMLVVSPLNSLFQLICLVLAFFTILLAVPERWLSHRAEYLALILLATAGLLILVSSEEFLMIFIGLELLGIGLYVMTAFEKSDRRSAEAGLKYFLFGSTASAFTLFGISLVYGTTGTTVLAGIARQLEGGSPLLVVGIVMTLIGFAFKIAAAPFHLWAPDAYEGAPVSSAAFIASASKVASFVVLGKIVLVGFAPVHGSAEWHRLIAGWSPLLATLAALSILLGNFTALAQRNVRRLLAYSAVAHAGYTLLGLVAGNREGWSATLFYTAVYAFTLLGAFGVCAVVRQQTGGDDLTDFRGLRNRSPFFAACMTVFILSLVGLPPLVGFFGKFYLFSAAFAADNQGGLLWLVVIAIFGSFVSLYYYLIVLKAIFIDETSSSQVERLTLPTDYCRSVTVAILALLVLLLGVAPGPLLARIIAALS